MEAGLAPFAARGAGLCLHAGRSSRWGPRLVRGYEASAWALEADPGSHVHAGWGADSVLQPPLRSCFSVWAASVLP